MVKCPKCYSEQITTNKKGFSGGKAVAGALLTGGVGLLAGTIGSNKVIITCLSCGNKFKPGERPTPNPKTSEPFSGTVNGNNAVVCGKCNHVNPLFYNKCKSCNAVLSSSDIRIHDPNIELRPTKNSGCAASFILLLMLPIILYYLF